MISFSLLFSNEKYIFLYDNRYFLHIPLFFKKRNGYRLNWTRNLSKNLKTREKLGVIQSELRYPIQLLNWMSVLEKFFQRIYHQKL